jgi:hypothetical protein
MIDMARLKTGEDIIGDFYADLSTKEYKINEPMVVEIEHGFKSSGLVMAHWLPVQLLQQNTITIGVEEILGFITPSDEFQEYYQSTVSRLRELLQAKKKIKELDESEYDDIMEAFEELSIGDVEVH